MIHFVKMHGIGNDYVYLDAFSDPAVEQRPDLPELARRMSDRHTGVGSDGLILVCRPIDPSSAQVRMRMFNADGSESEMCGNGVRCVAKFAHDRLGISEHEQIRIETGNGVLNIRYELETGRLVRATVDMGTPIRDWKKIPVDDAHVRSAEPNVGHVDVDGRSRPMTFVSMGNPHAVEFVEDPESVDLHDLGPKVEHHPAFPNRVNYHVARLAEPGRAGPNEIWMRTWERGAGPTLACGTGACAVVAAAVWRRFAADGATHLVHLPGGDLEISADTHAGADRMLMTGPATDVFEGDWPD